MKIHLEPIHDKAMFRQLAARLREEILSGQLNSGQSLKRSKELGLQLGVNLRVVHKAYKLLIEEGLVEWTRENGFRVSQNAPLHRETKLHLVEQEMRILIAKAQSYGVSLSEIMGCKGSCSLSNEPASADSESQTS